MAVFIRGWVLQVLGRQRAHCVALEPRASRLAGEELWSYPRHPRGWLPREGLQSAWWQGYVD